MRLLQDTSGSNSKSNTSSKERDFGTDDGWECINPTRESSDRRLIEKANNLLPLYVVFKSYNIFFEKTYSYNGWTHRCKCPFKDHIDKAPSFGYNSKKDCFNCFGCNRGGRSIQFLSYMNNIPQIEVAKRIISERSDHHENVIEINYDYLEVEQLLFDYADYVRKFNNKHNSDMAIKYSDAVTWNLDVYLRKNVPTDSIDIVNLRCRILKLKEQLDVYVE